MESRGVLVSQLLVLVHASAYLYGGTALQSRRVGALRVAQLQHVYWLVPVFVGGILLQLLAAHVLRRSPLVLLCAGIPSDGGNGSQPRGFISFVWHSWWI